MNSPFNEKRYRELLEGLEISEISFSQLNDERRIDAEYFSPKNITLASQLIRFGTFRIMDIADVTDGIHTSIDYDENSHINLISATSPRENVFDLSRQVFISQKAHKENPRTALKECDVIVSTVGTIGNCAVVDQSILPANSDRHVGIIRIKEFYSPYVLSTFILSKYGRMQTLRESTGNVQLNLFIYKLKELLVPSFSCNIQTKISNGVKTALNIINQANRLYSEATDLLLEELGMKDWRPNNSQINIKSLNESFLSSGRLDAEHYQEKYDELEERIKTVPHKTIAEIQQFNARGVQPDYVEGGSVSVVNSKHILEDGLDYDNLEHTTEAFLLSQKRAQIGYGDILIYTTGANIGRTQAYLKRNHALASNHVNILRVRGVNPIYLALVLNSPVGRMQTEKLCTGSAQAEIYPNDIEKFIVPILDETIQESIAAKVQECFAMKAESKRLLNVAKEAVEIAISDSEEKALQFIKESIS